MALSSHRPSVATARSARLSALLHRPAHTCLPLRLLTVCIAITLAPPVAPAQQTPVATRSTHAIAAAEAVDAGPAAGSQSLQLTLRLFPDQAQEAALDSLLAAQTDPSSPSYHHWLTPESYAEQFGASSTELSRLTDWLTLHGLTITAATSTRITLSGTASQAAHAFQTPVERMRTSAGEFFAAPATPSLPAAVTTRRASLSGLDDLPSTAAHALRLLTPPTNVAGQARLAAAATPSASTNASALEAIEAAVQANVTSVLTLDSSLCSADLAPSEQTDLRVALRQAQLQGITVVVSGSCASAADVAFPAALPSVTAVTLIPAADAPGAGSGTDPRPTWQTAQGLPADLLRHAPDLTTPSLAAFAETVQTLVRRVGSRVGNLNPRLYQIAATPVASDSPRLFDQTASDPWTSVNGLGTVDLAQLLKQYPRATTTTTTTSLIAPPYAINYGDAITFTSTVTPSSYGIAGTAGPTGTITFTASTQGVLGTVTLDSGGTATLTPDVLPVGVYSVIASYSGDANYAASTSPSNVTVTVSIVNAVVIATIAPQTNVPYGATATVTATVKLPGPRATPSGTVTAVIESVSSSLSTATLSPNPGGTTATANLVLSVPPQGSYTVQVTCQGTTNYQCQSPVNLTLGAVKGYTTTAIAVTPAAPQAGQPVALSATVANAGNGTGTYIFTGSVSFYDSGKLLTTVPVASNQAATTVTLSGNRAHTITATYTGDYNWSTSTSGAVSVTPTILPASLALSSTASNGTSLAGINIIFTGRTTTSITFGVGPTGTVTFFDTFNGSFVQLGNPATMVPNGTTASIALFTTTGLLAGTHSIYAVYSGDANYASATSAPLQLTISDFSLGITPTSLSLTQGTSQQVTGLLATSGGFTGTVTLGCIPPPASGAACNFAPASLTSGNATVLTINTAAATAALRRPDVGKSPLSPAVLGASSLAAVLWLLLPGRRQRRVLRKRPLGLLSLLIATTLISGSLGCGLGIVGSSGNSSSSSGSGSSSSGNPGTPLGTQNFTITAAAADGINVVRHTYQYQVTVQ